MRIDLVPIVEMAANLLAAIDVRSKSRASSAAHQLLGMLPDPTWAETAPGMSIWYGTEAEAGQAIEALRTSCMRWLTWLIDPSSDCEPDNEWPRPGNLIEATRRLEAFMPQNASVSANTAPTTSKLLAGSEPDKNASESSAP